MRGIRFDSHLRSFLFCHISVSKEFKYFYDTFCLELFQCEPIIEDAVAPHLAMTSNANMTVANNTTKGERNPW